MINVSDILMLRIIGMMFRLMGSASGSLLPADGFCGMLFL